MNQKIVFRASAAREFDEAFDWYESRRVGLGVDFVRNVQQSLSLISANPLLYGITFEDVRASAVRRFPFCIYYRIGSDVVEVIAVFHNSRDPSVWQERI